MLNIARNAVRSVVSSVVKCEVSSLEWDVARTLGRNIARNVGSRNRIRQIWTLAAFPSRLIALAFSVVMGSNEAR